MGGGGSYYDRDVTPTNYRGSSGYSSVSEQAFVQSRQNAATRTQDRVLRSSCSSPVVFAFDVTGSMGNLPKIIFDKMPMIAGELARQEYLKDAQMSLAAIGDVVSDQAPLQVADFSVVRSLDEWLTRLWLEGNGGGQAKESYEMMAYFYLKQLEMRGATTPIFLFTGDEGFREALSSRELREHFGGEHVGTNATKVFQALKEKFSGNVFLIRREYPRGYENQMIQQQWENVLGKENVIPLPQDVAIGDITLGVIALASGARSLPEYLDDIRNRPTDLGGTKFEPQSEARIKEVEVALTELARSRNLLDRPRKKKEKGTETVDGGVEKKSKNSLKKKNGQGKLGRL